MREQLEAKENRLQEVERRKNDYRMNLTQRKITETMTKLPAKERMEHLEKIENTTRGELKEVKRKPIEEVENKET